MPGTISPDVARAAVALRRSHAHVPAREVLDVVLRQRSGSLADFGPAACDPDQPFGALICEAFDVAMKPDEWGRLLGDTSFDAQQRANILRVWCDHVLPRFAAHYGLVA